jgi:hypothetical protein
MNKNIFTKAVVAGWVLAAIGLAETPSSVKVHRNDLEPSEQLLLSAEAQLPNLSPEMQTVALFTEGTIYAHKDRKKSSELLQRAYTLYLTLPDPDRADLIALGAEIVRATAEVSPRVFADALPENQEIRAVALVALTEYYAGKKQYAVAEQKVLSIEREPEVYQAAAALLGALPTSNAEMPDAVLLHAVKVFQTTARPQFSTGAPADLASLLVRFQERFGETTLKAAISSICDRVTDDGAGRQVEIIAKHGGTTVSFGSAGDFRLFQLLPLLERYDPGAADDWKKRRPQIADLLKEFPNGQRSIDNSFQERQVDASDITTYSLVRSGPAVENVVTRSNAEVAATRAVELSKTDWPRSLQEIEQLPTEVKLQSLLALARINERSDQARALEALDKISKTTAKIAGPSGNWAYLLECAKIYQRIGNAKAAADAVKEASRLVRFLYLDDSNPDNPNQAIKLFWPSAQAWRDVSEEAAKVSPAALQTLMIDIPDDEIRVFSTIVAAGAQWNVAVWRGTSPMIRKKEGIR